MIPRISIPIPSTTSEVPKLRAGAESLRRPASRNLLKNWKIVNPKTDERERSADDRA